MFNKTKFKAAMILAGKTQKDLADALNINTATLYRKVNGASEFTLEEIRILCEELNLDSPMDIFFSSEIA